MMAGVTKNSPIPLRGLDSPLLPESIFDLHIERPRLDRLEIFEVVDPSGRMCSCPICRSSSVVPLSELAQIPESEDEDGYVIPDVQIGATGIVMPGREQLARWFRVPVVPKQYKSRLHAKARIEAKHHSIFTFLSTFSFQTVFFSPCLLTLASAFGVGIIAGYRSYITLEKAANNEDQGIKLEMTVRQHAFQSRTSAWERLYYCAGCGMVHDREGKRSLPWYSMLQLVHYPEQEFQTIATPVEPQIVVPVEAPRKIARVA